jgi:hypothetical protein
MVAARCYAQMLLAALRMCLRGPGGSKGDPVTYGGLRAWRAPGGPHERPPYVTPILRAGLGLSLSG